ncbi:MAG: HAMP domain-containing histidine kinase [Desulfamplus sp.]|nr:HAMP domain-containing histidine kinase [Desulfamplus sp.]
MEPEIMELLSEWSPYVDEYLISSSAFAFGLFKYSYIQSPDSNRHDLKYSGRALFLNEGMKNMLGIEEIDTDFAEAEDKSEPEKRFINPDFRTLEQIARKTDDGLVFDDILTIGSESKSRSIQAKVFCRQNLLLVLCEYDVKELDTLNNTMVELNQELNNVQRELIKEKKMLTRTLSDLKNTQSKLVEAEKMASLGRLVAGFAHEINTPIGIALTASSALLDAQQSIKRMLALEEVDEEELVERLETINECSPLVINNLRRAADLVTSFKRTSIDHTVDNLRLYNLRETIDDIVISMRSQFQKTAIVVEVECPYDLELYGTPNDISQILLNLMSNSLLHGFDNGTIPGRIFIRAERASNDPLEKDELFIYYSDTGKGMDNKVVRQIFEPFFTTLRARGGTGLGMYICHNIVTTRLKGTIRCESIKGKGAEFFISFPILNV